MFIYFYVLLQDFLKCRKSCDRIKDIHDYNTRCTDKLYQQFSRLSICQKSPKFQQVMCYIKYIEIIRKIQSNNDFKRTLFKFLIGSALYSVENFLSNVV